MKKHLLLLFLTVFSLATNAQDAIKLRPALGVKGGVNYSRFAFNPDINQELLLGYTGGLVFKHFTHPNLGIQLEVNYVQRGWKELLGQDTSYTRTQDYIELPFLTHIAIGSRNTRFIINLGPYVSYLLPDSDNVDTDRGNEEDAPRYQFQEIDNEFLYGLCFGMGMLQKTSVGTLQLEARLTHSLNDIFDRDTGVTSSKNQSISVTLSYLLSFGPGKE